MTPIQKETLYNLLQGGFLRRFSSYVERYRLYDWSANSIRNIRYNTFKSIRQFTRVKTRHGIKIIVIDIKAVRQQRRNTWIKSQYLKIKATNESRNAQRNTP